MKALVGAFNQEKALVGAFSVIVQPVVEPMEHYTALLISRYIQDETDIIFHIRAYETRSVLLRNISPASMIRSLDKQLCLGLTGILQDIVRLNINFTLRYIYPPVSPPTFPQ